MAKVIVNIVEKLTHQIFFTTKLKRCFNIQNCINEIPGIKILTDKIFSNLHKLLATSTHIIEISQKRVRPTRNNH